MNALFDLELERTQADMLDRVKHAEQMEYIEFVLFLGSFKNRLDALGNWSSSLINPWLKVLQKHVDRIGFPKVYVGHLRSALSRKDIMLLTWVISSSKGLFSSWCGGEVPSERKPEKGEKA